VQFAGFATNPAVTLLLSSYAAQAVRGSAPHPCTSHLRSKVSSRVEWARASGKANPVAKTRISGRDRGHRQTSCETPPLAHRPQPSTPAAWASALLSTTQTAGDVPVLAAGRMLAPSSCQTDPCAIRHTRSSTTRKLRGVRDPRPVIPPRRQHHRQ
jgi:hypothetical protein